MELEVYSRSKLLQITAKRWFLLISLVFIVCALFFGAPPGYSLFYEKEGQFIGTLTHLKCYNSGVIAFEIHYGYSHRAKGLAAFPDGGIPAYTNVGTSSFFYNTNSGSATIVGATQTAELPPPSDSTQDSSCTSSSGEQFDKIIIHTSRSGSIVISPEKLGLPASSKSSS